MITISIIILLLIVIFIGTPRKRDTSFKDSYKKKRNNRKFK